MYAEMIPKPILHRNKDCRVGIRHPSRRSGATNRPNYIPLRARPLGPRSRTETIVYLPLFLWSTFSMTTISRRVSKLEIARWEEV